MTKATLGGRAFQRRAAPAVAITRRRTMLQTLARFCESSVGAKLDCFFASVSCQSQSGGKQANGAAFWTAGGYATTASI
jgi:hypothetical protein